MGDQSENDSMIERASSLESHGDSFYVHRRTTSVHRNDPRISTTSLSSVRRNSGTFKIKSIFKSPTLLGTLRHQSLPCIIENRSEMNINVLEDQALQIAQDMEKDETFMLDDPMAELLRMETIRDMPQCLTIKRCIKARLSKSIRKTKGKPMTFYKRLKYRSNMGFSKVDSFLHSILYSCELWYSSLKTIEGHYGTGVATYFRFLRSMFILNSLFAFFAFFFIVLPQILYQYYIDSVSVHEFKNFSKSFEELNISSSDEEAKFYISDLITGEGYLTNSTMYYGFYTNQTFSLNGRHYYSMPFAYFFVMFILYTICFVILSLRMARSYRKSFIETAGGLKNVYAHKIFCGWDFRIANENAAILKCQTLYTELRELLSESGRKKRNISLKRKFFNCMIRIAVNMVVILFIILTGFCMWVLLESYTSRQIVNETSTDQAHRINDRQSVALTTAVIITLMINAIPKLFSWIVRYEDYKSPRVALNITLLRTFVLEIVTISVLIFYWLNKTRSGCWETNLGQEIYRLIMMDFFLSVILSVGYHIIHYIIFKHCWRGIGIPEFDIAHSTMNLIYNQTLFWVGFYFSPLLAVVMVVKMFIQFHIKRATVLYLNFPSNKSWRAAQTHTLFLVMSFTSLLGVLMILGYILTNMRTSDCGPFKDYEYFYQMVLQGIFKLKADHSFFKLIMYLTKPGIVAGLLIAMCVGVYYLRAKSKAQIAMVEILREMLILEAKDKEFLLSNISKVTDGEWLYHLEGSQALPSENCFWTERSSTWRFSNKNTQTNDTSTILEAIPSTSQLVNEDSSGTSVDSSVDEYGTSHSRHVHYE